MAVFVEEGTVQFQQSLGTVLPAGNMLAQAKWRTACVKFLQ